MTGAQRLACIGLLLSGMTVPALADCADEVLTILDRAEKAGAYRVKMQGVVAGAGLSAYAETVPGHGMRAINRFDGAGSEVIVIGDRAWENYGGSGWRTMPADLARAMAKGVAAANFAADAVLDAVCERDVARAGQTLRRYSFRLPETPGTLAMLVEPDTGLPAEIRLSVEGEVPSVMKFAFDPDIALEPPPGF